MISDRDVIKPLVVAWGIKVTTLSNGLHVILTSILTFNISRILAKHER